MLTKADRPELKFTSAARTGTGDSNIIERKVWLPKTLYDALPWFYLFSGIAALLATLYISAWFWVLPHYFLFSAACLHLSALVFRKRWRGKVESDCNAGEN
jgi:hypothetical protein